MTPLLVGIFVGGSGTRMGGIAKGLLTAPDGGEPLVARLTRISGEALPGSGVVLVGDPAAYALLGLSALVDDPPASGPLGGLRALLAEGARTERDVITLACDLPFVTAELVARLAAYAPESAAVAPRNAGGRWEPLFARYSRRCVKTAESQFASGRRSLRSVLEALGGEAVPLPVTEAEWRLLRDWDTPEDRDSD
ncbi:MAG TPA: molybdenum cofactor guanylyltransferase [Polyangiaceae bacterium]|nr:molybdenum cofactor guanylyltransferase [Polyangiaceae bacterium]